MGDIRDFVLSGETEPDCTQGDWSGSCAAVAGGKVVSMVGRCLALDFR